MARLDLTGNGPLTSTSVDISAGVYAISVKGSLGGGQVQLEHLETDANTSTDWSAVTAGTADSPTVLAITTTLRSIQIGLPRGKLRAKLVGGTSSTAVVSVAQIQENRVTF